MPEGQLRRLVALPGTGVRGWGDRAEEHMSYGWLQSHTRAKEEPRRHLGEVGGAVNVDAEEAGGEEGGDASSMQSSKSGGSKGKGCRPRKAPKLSAKSGGQPSGAKPLPVKQAAAHADAAVAAQAGVMPEWQKRAVAAEGEVRLLRGKLQEEEQRAHGAERMAKAAELEHDNLPAQVHAQARKPKSRRARRGSSRKSRRKGGGGGGGRSTLWRRARPGRSRQRG